MEKHKNNLEFENAYIDSICINFVKWVADNKWYKQTKYDIWEKSGVGLKSTLELFEIFKKTL